MRAHVFMHVCVCAFASVCLSGPSHWGTTTEALVAQLRKELQDDAQSPTTHSEERRAFDRRKNKHGAILEIPAVVHLKCTDR